MEETYSEHEPEKFSAGCRTITFSPTGGTKKVVDILANRITGNGEVQDIDLCDPKESYAAATLSSNDIALIAVPSYGGRVPVTAAARLSQIQGNRARAILVCVYGNRAYDNTLAEMADIAQKSGFRVVAAVAALAEHSIARQVAAGRPDAADVERLQEMADEILEKIISGDTSVPAVPGSIPEKQGMSMGIAPGVAENCTKCGLCAEKCPVGAIDIHTFESDRKKCISCMRCISVCPQNARKLNVVVTSLGGVALSVLCKKRKECELFL